jgi:SAM-dependent methyltransferase
MNTGLIDSGKQSCSLLLAEVRRLRRKIDRWFATRILPAGLANRRVRRTRHFRQWYRLPMNYVRIVELPLSLLLLDTSPTDRIVDLSSPKLLSLYLAAKGWRNLTIGDIEDYFVEDFRVYADLLRTELDVQLIDARNTPFADASLDRAFSISVFEHIPEMGDREAVQEVARVLKPGGVFVLTLPAFREYVEEWQTAKSYWDAHSITRPNGAVFYQRRYDETALHERFGGCGFDFEDIVYIAEQPIEEPRIGPNGQMLHNVYFVHQRINQQRFLRWKRRFPFYDYYPALAASKRLHYLTRNAADPNIRQVALKLRRQ